MGTDLLSDTSRAIPNVMLFAAGFGTRMGAYGSSEIALAQEVLPHLRKGMLCLADRNFFGYPLWGKARASGADLLWRIKKNLMLPCQKRLPDGSYLSRIYPSRRDRRRSADPPAGKPRLCCAQF